MRGQNFIFGFTAVLASMAPAYGVPLTLTYDTYFETKILTTPLDAATPIRMDGLLPDRGGAAISNTLTFRAGSSSLSLSAGWQTAPLDVRTIGVNIDLVDTFSNVVVASDSFLGLTGALAKSNMVASGLTPGAQYALVMTGTAIQGGRFQIDLVDGSTPPPIPAVPVVPTSPQQAVFDTLNGVKRPVAPFAAGDFLQIDGRLTESGAISDAVGLRVTSSTLSAGIEWLVAPGPLRTIGVNVDLINASNVVVASDVFMGITAGQAFSQLAVGGLTPGDYTLLFTGNALDGGRFRINLTTDPTAPGFEPIPTDTGSSNVPEPQSLLLLMIAGGGILASRRRKKPLADKPA